MDQNNWIIWSTNQSQLYSPEISFKVLNHQLKFRQDLLLVTVTLLYSLGGLYPLRRGEDHHETVEEDGDDDDEREERMN